MCIAIGFDAGDEVINEQIANDIDNEGIFFSMNLKPQKLIH